MQKRAQDASSGATLDWGRWLSASGAFTLAALSNTHSGCPPSFFTQVLCCVLSSLGGTGDVAEQSTTRAQLQGTSTLNIQSRSRARQGALQTLSRERSKSPLPGSRSAPSRAFPALDVSPQSGQTRTGH
eukprot:1431663-Rhodomonas_salina.1